MSRSKVSAAEIHLENERLGQLVSGALASGLQVRIGPAATKDGAGVTCALLREVEPHHLHTVGRATRQIAWRAARFAAAMALADPTETHRLAPLRSAVREQGAVD